MLRKKSRPRSRSSRWPRAAGMACVSTLLLSFYAAAEVGAQDKNKGAKVKRETPAAGRPTSEGTDAVLDEILKVNYVFNRGLYDLALPRYEKLLDANPTYARADLIHYPLALCHYNLALAQASPTRKTPAGGDADAAASKTTHLQRAVTHLKEAMRRKEFESKSAAMRLLGQTFLLLEDFDNAAKTLQWVVDKTPDSPEVPAARLGLAESFYFQGKYTQAAATYEQAIASGLLGEEAERAEFYLAMALFKGEPVPGKATLEACRKNFASAATRETAKGPGRYAFDARYMLAVVLEAQGNLDGAIEAFSKLAGAGSAEYAELAQFGLASSLFRAGRTKDSVDELQRFVDTYPSSQRRDEVLLYLARALADTQQAVKAGKILNELRTSKQVGDEAALHLARLLTRNGKHRSAATALSAALKSFPSSRLRDELTLELISAHVSDGSFDSALAEIARLEVASGTEPNGDGVKATPSTGDQTAYLKAYALHRAKRYEESSTACATFRSTHPESRYLKDVVQIDAENKLLLGDVAGARAAYEALLENFGKDLDTTARLKARFRAAQAVYAAKDFSSALSLFDQLATDASGPEAEQSFRQDPLLRTLDYLQGDCAYQLKDSARAEKELTAFLIDVESRPGIEVEATDARFKVAHSMQLAGDLKRAQDAYRAALRADAASPHQEQILFELGQVAYGLKEFTEATRSFEALLAEHADSRFVPHAIKLLGWMAYDARETEKSLGFYTRLLREFPDHPAAQDAEFHRAAALRDLGRSDEAREALSRFRASRPDDPRAGRAELEEAIALAKEKKSAAALTILDRLLAEKPAAATAGPILYEQAWCHRDLGDLSKARQAYEALLALEASPELLETSTLELGELEFEAKDFTRARQLLEPLSARPGPRREKATYRLIWTLQMLEDAAGVVKNEAAFSKLFPQSELTAELGLLAAKAHLSQGDNARAAKVYQSIVETRPEAPEAEIALVGLGECLAEDRKFEEARSRSQAFLERYPGSQQGYRARFVTAWALENLGKPTEALPIYRAVVKETRTALGARAQFQAGQCLVAQKDFKGAVVEFLQVPATFSYPEWNARALLQIAGSFEALEDFENAHKYYTEVKETYPERDEAQVATERLKKIETK